ncbi:transmembrane protein, putative (macronuclear) [Tetrahymena thermophila SB210]|uniref:Transmembrane protein, putative n=1 Tax=Tetrahymena thermophila (strain SB210) TaxID=312017 RepID=I7LTC6_TETTS|nr:transmembrane protein, putative [Tetrahymena thermophila SB210]EAR85000.2 transmembrane protein, putative [Tetrahymena thermophila SB210]|eukprot:XP_001032663.2 transmembrane protein, putative [Tetrahymena thermophila SB210]
MSSQNYISSKNNVNAQNQNPFSSQQSQMHPSTEYYDYQTAQFIKTHTHIQNNNNINTLITNSNNNINGNLNGANTFLANSQQSSSNQNKKSVASKKNSIGNREKIEPMMTASINHMIINNQSMCQGLNEESMEKSNISQFAGVNNAANQKVEQFLLKKKQEKSRFKEVLRSRNILFLAIIIFVYQADTIYIHTQTIKNIEISLASKIFLYILIILQTTIAILFILLGCKKQDYCQIILKQKQSYFGISQIVLIIAYYESVSIALGVVDVVQNQITDEQEINLKIVLFRFFNILILNASYSFLIRTHRFKLFIYASQLIYFPLRFFMISLKGNYIQFLVVLTAFVGLYFQSKLLNEHISIKKQILISTKYQKLISGTNFTLNNKNITANNNNVINNMNNNANSQNNNSSNNKNQNAGSYLQQSNKGSPPEKDEIQDLLNKQSFNNFNNNQSIQGFQVSYPFISYHQSQQGSQLQKQQSLGQNMNTYYSQNKIEVQNINNTNNNQLVSYNSLNGSLINLEKPATLLEQNNHSSQIIFNNKRSQFGQTQSSQHIQSGFDLNNNFISNVTPIQNQIINQGIQNIIKSEKMHQMSKISEQDFENDFSKNHYNTSNQMQNFTQNGQSMVEQKSLIEQVIEVDGIVVFDQETQNVIFANQNILVLLETDVNRVLQEVMSLKQLHVSVDDKSNKENLEYSNTFLLKNLLKDNSINLLNASPAIGPQNNSTKMSNKIGSNPQLNRVIEEENEQDFSPQLIVKGEVVKQEGGKVEQVNLFNFSENMVEELSKQGTDKKSLSMLASGTQSNQVKNHQQNKQKYPKSKSHVYTKSRSQNYKANPFYLSPNQELQPDEDEGVSGTKTHKNESTFKKLSCDNTHQNPISNFDLPSYVQNNYDGQSFLQNRQLRESQDFQIPSFISSISHIPRKNTNQGSYTTFERERTNTLKDIMDDVRSKSGTFLAQQRKSTMTQQRKKTLNNKKQLNYSQQPETVINNMVLCKENTQKIYVMKYSIVEHAGKVLHIITIRDLSNEIFEQILDRQSSVLIDELYRYLNFTEISQILGKSLKQIKSLKYQIQINDYKQFISPLKLNLKLYKYLMSDIFDIRSLQHRSFVLNKDYFDLQQELINAKKMTEKLRNDIVFNFYYDKMIPIQILNDKERISQILMNLLVNCCKLIKNNKIFLKAKLCKDQSQVKIIIQNRELKKSQKELILKSYQSRLNSLGYHFFISNLLAKQVSNQIHKLEIISNKQEYVKFKFFIYLFTHASQDISQINLIKPSLSTNPQQGKSNNTMSNENKNQSNTQQQQYINSLSHLDIDIDDQNEEDKKELTQREENKIDESPPTHLDKGQINITSNIIKDSKNSSNDNNQKSEPSGNQQKSNKKTLQLNQEQQQVFNQDFKSLKTISNEGTEISEQIDKQKIKDFDNFQANFPMKFISDLQQQI